MELQHKSASIVKEYLLGTLPPNEAVALEEKYFVDRSFFLDVQKAEDELIADYLARRLSAADRQGFEDRYLQNPLLKEKLERARAARLQSAPARPGFGRLVLPAAAILFVALASLVLVWYQKRLATPPLVAQVTEAPLELQLTPGVTMSSEPKGAEVRTPLPAAGIRMKLELPGVSSPVLCTGAVSRIGTEGSRHAVWTSPQLTWSSPGPSGQQELSLAIPSAVLPPGDYLVEVTSPSASLVETYLFRVAQSR